MLGGENIHPHPGIGDGFFDFKLISAKQFNFIDVFTAELVCDSDEYTFWKVERYTNNTLEKTFYFYTNRVINYLKNAFTLELVLDVYLTYTRHIIKELPNKTEPIKVGRGTITAAMLNFNPGEREVLLKALSNVDSGVAGGDDAYKEIKHFPIVDYSREKSSNLYPIKSYKQTYQSINISPLHWYTGLAPYPAFGTTQEQVCNVYSVNPNETQTGIKIKVEKISNSYRSDTRLKPVNSADTPKLNQMIKTLQEAYKLSGVYFNDNRYQWEEINQNVMNGYFAVFRHALGYIDAYPIIGNMKVSMNLPIAENGNSTAISYTSTANYYITNNTYILDLKNDWYSIEEEYIKNVKEWYGADGFVGIFKWAFPAGANSKLSFVLQEIKSNLNEWAPGLAQVNFNWNGQTKTGYVNKPIRMFYRFTFSDIVGFNLCESERKANGDIITKPFTIYDESKYNNIIYNYVNLLQPIVIANNQIIPAKYSFLTEGIILQNGNLVKGFTIPVGYGFTNGFKLFCKIHMYNSASLGISFGGTLPATTSKYFNQLASIEQQQNAGIASAVGNMLGRPLNWLSAGFGGNNTEQLSDIASDTQAFNQTTKYGPKGGLAKNQPHATLSSTQNSGWNWTDTNNRTSNYGVGIGGLGGFIGDFVNIHNTIQQSAIAKRNLGIGYLSTTDDDMYNSLVNNAYISTLKGEEAEPLSQGLFSTGSKLIFDDNTREKYIYFYTNWGFPINSFVSDKYFYELLAHLNYGPRGGMVYVELDRNWCLTNLTDLSNYNDNVIRNAIIDQLVGGVRMRWYN